MSPAAILLLLVNALLVVSAHAASPNMREGLWEITTRMEMSGSSGVAMPAQTVRHCVTKNDIENPQGTPPGGAGRDGRCKMTDYKLQGNTATWKMACEGQGAMTGTGTMTYSGNSYSGSQTMAMNQGGQAINMKMNYSGQRVGDCPKK